MVQAQISGHCNTLLSHHVPDFDTGQRIPQNNLLVAGLGGVVEEPADEGDPQTVQKAAKEHLSHSEENGGTPCLDIIPGEVRYFGNPLAEADGTRLKVPHMGWNQVRQTMDHPLWHGIPDMTRFYFVHSYYVDAVDRDLLAGSVHYGVDADAALARDNLFAVQFHPEKSADAGLKLLKNFLEWNGQC